MEYRSDELKHYGTLGMKWGQRNGPPYPLQRFQKAASEAIIKGKRAMGDAYEKEKVKYKIKKAKIEKERQLEKEDLDRRKADLARRNRLRRMNPKLLTKQELDELTNRKRSEDSYREAFKKKKKKDKKNNATDDLKKTLVKDLVGTVLVESGKAAVISALTNKDFRTVATSRIDKAWKQKDNKDNDNNDNKDNKDKKNKGTVNRTYNFNLFSPGRSESQRKEDKRDKK